MLKLKVSILQNFISNRHSIAKYIINSFSFFLVVDKENIVALPIPLKKEESHKREINRDDEKEDKNKRLRKAESKENVQPPSAEKKQVFDIID